jgi:hypothetical protein
MLITLRAKASLRSVAWVAGPLAGAARPAARAAARPASPGRLIAATRGHAFPAGGQFDSRSAATWSLTVVVRLPVERCRRAASGARAASGPALRVRLPPENLGSSGSLAEVTG